MVMVIKKGQVTIFIILGILIVFGITGYFMLRENSSSGLSADLEKGYNSYIACIEQRTNLGLKMLGQQGGFLYLEELPFESGNAFSPVSSQLNFYGNSVPYWNYLSGNNILKKQKPTLIQMESDLSRFVYEGLTDCDFLEVNSQGIFVDVYNGSVQTKINSENVEVTILNPVYISSENESSSVSSHFVKVDSKLGKFYDLASKLDDLENNDLFLEAYALDVMRLYAPVTGVDLSCAPKVFNEFEVKNSIVDGIENNFPFLKLKGNYYSLSNSEQNYYVIDLGENVNENVNFIYSREWPTKIEMYGDKVVQPLGSQSGVGVLGMCFVPYHFVYDISFPILVQFYDNGNLFQFASEVIIKQSQSREAKYSGGEITSNSQICQNRNQDIKISTYDLSLNPVSANIRFSCLGDSCEIGTTKVTGLSSKLDTQIPQCVNGVLSVYAEGYSPVDYAVSSNTESSVEILLKKIYTVKVDLGNVEKASLVFSSQDYSGVLSYPESNSINLVEGDYNISAYVYDNASIEFPAVQDRKCLTVPSSSIGGIIGETEERCFDVDIPAQKIDSALVGGGKSFDYFTEEQLGSSQKLNIVIPNFGSPSNIEDLQDNYLAFETSDLELTWS